VDHLESRLGERGAAIQALESELARAKESLVESERMRGELEVRVGALDSELDVRDQLLTGGKPWWLLEAPRGQRDALQAIRGLGPVFEQRLNGVGIFHFDQLARLESREELEWLASQINVPPSRIRREGWPEQAARMCAQRQSNAS
jgi:hypothetical protein